MKTKRIAIALFCFMIKNPISFGQQLKGLFQGYQGEWSDVSEQLIALGEATPEDKFTWRPAQGVRSTSEVYMHIERADYLMLNAIGWKREASILLPLRSDLDFIGSCHGPSKSKA